MRCYTFLPGTFSTKLNSDLSAKMNPLFMNKINIKKTLWNSHPFCFVCKRRINHFSDATLEHIIPKSKGGTNKKLNLTLSHSFCNQLKDNLILKDEWEKKLHEHEKNTELILRRRIHDTKTETALFVFCLILCESDAIENYMPQKSLIKKFRKCDDLSILIEASSKLHHYRVPKLWELIFGVLFLQHYYKTKDILAFLHSSWRLNRFLKQTSRHHLAPIAIDLIEICKGINYSAYEKLVEKVDGTFST